MSERKGTIGEADWAVDSARSDELASSGPPEQVQLTLQQLVSRSKPPPTSSSPLPPPPATVPFARVDRDAATTVGPEPPPPTRAAADNRTARSLGKYQFIATLGRGGMADVHLAVSVGPAGFSKLQVIKRLRPTIADEPEFRNMLLDEARLAARLNHRNVVQTNEVGLVDDEYFIAMEYLEGQPLSRVISRARERERPIPLAISLWVLCEVLAGLHYAHELVDYDGTPLHVVHRDVSPHNIFITYDGQVKVVDFGIALAARRVVETQAGTLKGKIAYMAPEQAFSPSSEIDRRADIFSVGIILWELIAGRRMWRGLTDPQIISRLLREVPDVRTARPDVPFELARVCTQALSRSPDQRQATAAELRAELERYTERLGEQVTAQQLGELVSELFASERAEIRAIIDRQLKALRDRTADGAGVPGESSARHSMLPSLPVREPYDSYVPEDGAITASSPSVPRRSTPPQGTLHAVVRPDPEPAAPPEPARPRSRLPLIAAGAVIAALGATTLFLRLRQPERVVAVPDATAPSTAPAPPAPPPATAVVNPSTVVTSPTAPTAPQGAFLSARIKVTPPEAKILVDGSELPANPFEGKFVKDGAYHRIDMQAFGYVAQRRMQMFDKDINIEVSLFAMQNKPAPTAAPSSAPVAPAATTAPDPDVSLPAAKPDPY